MTAGRDIVLEKATTRAPETGSNGGTTASSRPPVSAWNRRKKSPSSPYTTRRNVARGTSNTVSISTSLIAGGRGGGARDANDSCESTRAGRRANPDDADSRAREKNETRAGVRASEGARARPRAAPRSTERRARAARDRGAERGGCRPARCPQMCVAPGKLLSSVFHSARDRSSSLAHQAAVHRMAPGSREQLDRPARGAELTTTLTFWSPSGATADARPILQTTRARGSPRCRRRNG